MLIPPKVKLLVGAGSTGVIPLVMSLRDEETILLIAGSTAGVVGAADSIGS
jgi:hypothetical protein